MGWDGMVGLKRACIWLGAAIDDVRMRITKS